MAWRWPGMVTLATGTAERRASEIMLKVKAKEAGVCFGSGLQGWTGGPHGSRLSGVCGTRPLSL